MKRVNIYITQPQEERISTIADVLNVTRAEIVRRAVDEFGEKHQKEIDSFMKTFNESEHNMNGCNWGNSEFSNQCAVDPKFFIKNAVRINALDYKDSPFNMEDLQSDLIDILYEYNEIIINKSRQCGGTVTNLAYMLHYAAFKSNKKIVILCNKSQMANELLRIFKSMLLNLPKFIQPKIEINNNRMLQLDNGTQIVASSIENCASIDVLKASPINYIYMDEVAWANPTQMRNFMMNVYPSFVSQGSGYKLVISSSPHGFNHFYRLWSGALTNDNNLKPVCIPWWAVPGRDENWKREQIKHIGENMFKQEFECKFIGNNILFPGLKEAPAMSFE